jgi:hypothetical protein
MIRSQLRPNSVPGDQASKLPRKSRATEATESTPPVTVTTSRRTAPERTM